MREEIHHHIHVLTGPVQGGKTSLLKERIALLKKGGIRVMGFICPGTISQGRRSEFQLENIHTGQRVAMGSEKEKKGWVKYRRFYFNPEAFSQGKAWIEKAVSEQADLLVIDEVGPMELEGMGWSEILDFLENKTGVFQLWIVRQQILPEVLGKWKIPEDQIFTFETIEDLMKKWKQ